MQVLLNGDKSAGYKRRCNDSGVPFDSRITLNWVLERDGYECRMECCCYDTRVIDPDVSWSRTGPIPDEIGTIDHIVPLSTPGSPGHVETNVRAAHRLCNREAFSP